jgi:hypothetical protein
MMRTVDAGRAQARVGVLATAALIAAMTAGSAGAENIRRIYRTAPARVGLNGLANDPRYQNAADGILESAVRNIPIHPSMSPAFTFRYDQGCGCFQRSSDDIGPWFMTERAQTVGKGLIHASVTAAEYNVRCANGCKLGDEFDPINVSAAAIAYRAGTELIYQVATLNLTYGVTDDLDVNVAIPVGALDFGLNASRRDPTGATRFGSAGGHPLNIMDIMVRAKYRLFNWDGMVGAMGLRARIPTGDPGQGLGTGYGEVGPFFALSKSFFDGMVGSHWTAGMDFGTSQFRHSSANYSWGLTLQPPKGNRWHDRIALTGGVGGRSEVNGRRARTSVSGRHVTPAGITDEPYLCYDPGRHDYFDATLGVRVGIWRTLAMTLGFYKAINESEGVRATNFSPVGSIEATF